MKWEVGTQLSEVEIFKTFIVPCVKQLDPGRKRRSRSETRAAVITAMECNSLCTDMFDYSPPLCIFVTRLVYVMVIFILFTFLDVLKIFHINFTLKAFACPSTIRIINIRSLVHENE